MYIFMIILNEKLDSWFNIRQLWAIENYIETNSNLDIKIVCYLIPFVNSLTLWETVWHKSIY